MSIDDYSMRMKICIAGLALVPGVRYYIAKFITELAIHEKTIMVWMRCSEMLSGRSQAGNSERCMSRQFFQPRDPRLVAVTLAMYSFMVIGSNET